MAEQSLTYHDPEHQAACERLLVQGEDLRPRDERERRLRPDQVRRHRLDREHLKHRRSQSGSSLTEVCLKGRLLMKASFGVAGSTAIRGTRCP